ncbi:MAG: cob(I)yrinic acid a,c-diamide adenosyltransferase [Mycoplasma sp.]|nr:cob(I)yrinic acid a,c-diamide adenosyltransferase [Mycoplasma sp.]
MIQIYYGFGKGKTSAANGMAIRSLAINNKVMIARFLKGMITTEDTILKKIGVDIVKRHPSEKFVIEMNEEEKVKAKEEVVSTLNYIKNNYKKYDLIIIDEFLDLHASTVGFFTENEMFDFIKEISSTGVEIIITGHVKINSIFEKADLVTLFNNEKHYFDAGVKARIGFEY